MSSDDADDERESPAPTPVVEWVDHKSLRFTLFVVLPNEEICTLRDLNSGISVFDLKGRLELLAGIPCQLYSLIYPDGEELPDEQKLVVRETVIDGYLLKIRVHDNWKSLYVAVTRNEIEKVYHSGGVHLKGNITVSAEETGRYKCMVKERGGTALYMAACLGLTRMVNMLLSVGVSVKSSTYFGRTALHGAAARDQVAVLQILVNKDADLSQKDSYGVSPSGVASQMDSCLCLRQIRIIQLNRRTGPKHSSAKSMRCSTTTRSNTYVSRSSGLERTHSALSLYSDGSSILRNRFQTHLSRKDLSASAPLSEMRNNLNSSNGTLSTISAATTSKIRQKRNVKWQECSHWQVVEIPRKIEETVHVKPVTYSLPPTILKFSEVNCQKLREEKESLKNAQKDGVKDEKEIDKNSADRLTPEMRQAMRFTKHKLNYYRKLAEPPNDYIPMANRTKNYLKPPPEDSPAFTLWLARKDEEMEDAVSITSEESGEYFNQSDSEEDKMFEFNKRVRKMNRNNNGRSLTPGNRPLLNVMTFGSTTGGDSRNPPACGNITAYKSWKTTKGNNPIVQRTYTSKDLMAQKRKLEEKRQRLLLNAISYEEWLDHTEERKFLIRQILKADSEEMKRLEEERVKDKQKLYSYDLWMEKLEKREREAKKRKHIQKKYDDERLREKLEFSKSSFAVPYDEWLQKKGVATQKQQTVFNKPTAQKQSPFSRKQVCPEYTSCNSVSDTKSLRSLTDNVQTQDSSNNLHKTHNSDVTQLVVT